MVHKKSEYRLSYKWLPADIKREILETSATNLDYRVQRRQRDLWHHPWETHLWDDSCECDETDDGDQFLPLPQIRQKHKMLVEEWNRKAPPPPAVCVDIPLLDTPHTVEHKFHPKSIENKSPDQLRNTSFRSIGAGAAEPRFSPLPINEAAAAAAAGAAVMSRDEQQSHISHRTDLKSHSNRIRDYSSVKNRFDGGHRLTMALSDRAGAGYEVVRNPRRRRTDVVPTVVASRKPPAVLDRPSSSSACTVNRQQQQQQPVERIKPPFHTYGWANAGNTIGKQQTHNIRVQSNEVHPTALLAKKIKNELSQPNLINFATKKSKSSSILSNFSCPINHSSLWTTEYQRNFSTKGP